ncbi:PH domain-containing protein [Mucilaginibacter sp. UR6-1]|uniref:PH domain-containing protein n=1 Tax=Mucilaginibacter sp. UR6-1 TaxID=1435643 RepID=UPI001E2901AA|nr:PH domain-containing protein [Mucilaginibacter sp. UR6-1]MCC8410722.1 PH domain-containing protein [Mucilaginibacter sp. UR6-1]
MNINDQTIEILPSKNKMMFLGLGCIAFVMLGIFILISKDNHSEFYNIKKTVIAIVCILFFGLGIIISILSLADNRPALVLNEEGITINSPIGKTREIPWNTITGFDIARVRHNKFFLIYINNSAQLIGEAKGIGKLMMKFSQNTYGTPISISAATLKVKSAELESLLAARITLQAKSSFINPL